MSLLLDALKQAALEKKRQDMLAAERALNENKNDADSQQKIIPSEIEQSNNNSKYDKESVNNDFIGFVNENDNIVEEVPTPAFDLQQKASENKKIHEQEVVDASDDVKQPVVIIEDFDFGHVELFEKDKREVTSETELTLEGALSIKSDEDAEILKNTDQVNDAIEISEEQEKNVALLIEKSNRVYNRTRWRFYACYFGLCIITASIWSYQYFSIPILAHASAVNIDEQYPNIVDSETLHLMIKNSVAETLINEPKETIVEQEVANITAWKVNDDPVSAIESSIKTTNEKVNKPVEVQQVLTEKPILDNTTNKIHSQENEQPSISDEFEAQAQPIIIQRESPSTLSSDLNKAYALYQAGKLIEAKKIYGNIGLKYPYQKDAFLGLAAIAARTNNANEALDYYQQVLTIDPDNQFAKSGLLSLQASAVENPQWLAKLDELVFQNPNSPHLHFLKANVFAMRQQWRAAQASYFKAWENSPNNPDYTFNLAVSLDQLQQTKQALDFYQKAQGLIKNSPHNINEEALNRRIKQLKGIQ